MISQIFNSGSFKVLALFALSPGSRFRRNDIKEKTRMYNVPLDSALLRLVSSGIIKKDMGLYSVNLENPFTEQIISIASSHHRQMKNLPLDVYFLLADMVDELSTNKDLEMWLFGSYSKMVYNEKSDVDIALLIPQGFDKKRIIKVFRKLDKQYGKKIEDHFFDAHAFYRNKRDPLVKDIIKNGIRLI